MNKIFSALTSLPIGVLLVGVASAQELRGLALVEALRQGGYVLYFRHAATDWSLSDHVVGAGDWRSCDPGRMRQPSPAGRADAEAIGSAIRALGIGVHSILSSEYCRAVETARLLGTGKVQTTLDITNLRAAEFVGGREAAIHRFRKLLARPVSEGSNIILVGHGNLVRDATSVYPGEGGCAIFVAAPSSEFGYQLVGKLTSNDWSALAKAFAVRR